MFGNLIKSLLPDRAKSQSGPVGPQGADASPSAKEVFTRIYRDGVWNFGQKGIHSGAGSHAPAIVEPYVEALSAFLRGLPAKPVVVDLGCGDFNVGSRLRPYCAAMIACDIVEEVIAHNREKFATLDVDFRTLDLSSELLPDGDVVTVRQVLQHLSNLEIHSLLRQMRGKYRYAVVTEHLPPVPDFIPNVDKPTGADIRVVVGSGVVLTSPPFNLRPQHVLPLCEAAVGDGVIRSVVYIL